ncbi:STM4015 family protein, partial [Singulisphaera rosea]
MTIQENLDEFAGLPVKDFDPDEGIEDPSGIAYRLRLDYDASESGATMVALIARFLEDPGAGEITTLVIGAWEDVYDTSNNSGSIVRALADASGKLTQLRSLFLGDIVAEEAEISWIAQSDVTPLLDAYPALETLRVRGGSGLALGTVRHPSLTTLIIETGGLGAEVV